MSVRSILRPILFALLAVLSACHTPRKTVDEVAVPAPQVPVVPVVSDTIVGRVSLVATDNTFLVFQLEAGQTVDEGEELAIRFAGATVGKVKVTSPIKKPFVSTDILQGTAEKDYEIVRTGGGANPNP
jgi:hypothetical protein